MFSQAKEEADGLLDELRTVEKESPGKQGKVIGGCPLKDIRKRDGCVRRTHLGEQGPIYGCAWQGRAESCSREKQRKACWRLIY